MNLIIELIVLGVVFYFVNMIPMADPFPKIVKAVAVIVAILIVLHALGYAIPLHIN